MADVLAVSGIRVVTDERMPRGAVVIAHPGEPEEHARERAWRDYRRRVIRPIKESHAAR
jgi:hypothetical protein